MLLIKKNFNRTPGLYGRVPRVAAVTEISEFIVGQKTACQLIVLFIHPLAYCLVNREGASPPH